MTVFAILELIKNIVEDCVYLNDHISRDIMLGIDSGNKPSVSCCSCQCGLVWE